MSASRSPAPVRFARRHRAPPSSAGAQGGRDSVRATTPKRKLGANRALAFASWRSRRRALTARFASRSALAAAAGDQVGPDEARRIKEPVPATHAKTLIPGPSSAGSGPEQEGILSFGATDSAGHRRYVARRTRRARSGAHRKGKRRVDFGASNRHSTSECAGSEKRPGSSASRNSRPRENAARRPADRWAILTPEPRLLTCRTSKFRRCPPRNRPTLPRPR